MTQRADEVAWVLDHLDDLDSDFSAIHHVHDFRALPAPRMFALIHRLPAYGGVMAIRAREWAEEQQETAGADEVSSDLHTLTTHPGLAGLVEIGG